MSAFQLQHDNQPIPKIILSDDERRVLQQCNRESFWFRSKYNDEIYIGLFSVYKLEMGNLVRVMIISHFEFHSKNFIVLLDLIRKTVVSKSSMYVEPIKVTFAKHLS